MTETNIVAEGHSEVSAVLSFSLRSLEVERPVILTICGHDVLEYGGMCTKVVAIGLYKDHIFGPSGGTVIAHRPGLFEWSARGDFKHVRDAFLYEASLVGDLVSF